MHSLNYALLGDPSIAAELGKKATQTDIATYDRKTGDAILTLSVATGYPEKLQPLVQMLAFTRQAILHVTTLDPKLGEQVVAADLHGPRPGFLLHDPAVDPGRVATILRGTGLEGLTPLSGLKELKEKAPLLRPPPPAAGEARVAVDQCFEVKGLGTVALGVVLRGTVRKHDDLLLWPARTPVQIRSVQMHDDDVPQAPAGARVGLALKGVASAEVSRGEQLAPEGTLETAAELRFQFRATPYCKKPVTAGSQYHLQVGAQIHPGRARLDGGALIFSSDKPFAHAAGDRALLLDLNNPGLRIVGGGVL
ncbi:MAG: EF-Tu/IF-2/RF-3 family GTPase [Halobacteria archaeon]